MVQDSVPVDVTTAVEVPLTGPVVTGAETPEVIVPEAVPVGPTDAGVVSVAEPVLEIPVDPPTDPVDVPTLVAPVPEGPVLDVKAAVLPVLVDPPLGGTAVDEDLPEQLRVRVERTAVEEDLVHGLVERTAVEETEELTTAEEDGDGVVVAD